MSESDQPYPIYAISQQDAEKIEKAFTYHSPKGNQPVKYVAVRDADKELVLLMAHTCPPSRELSLALTNLEQAVMWANSAIARNE